MKNSHRCYGIINHVQFKEEQKRKWDCTYQGTQLKTTAIVNHSTCKQ